MVTRTVSLPLFSSTARRCPRSCSRLARVLGVIKRGEPVPWPTSFAAEIAASRSR
jgi:hypothetical protein